MTDLKLVRECWDAIIEEALETPPDPVVMDFYLRQEEWGTKKSKDDDYPTFCMGFDLGRKYGERKGDIALKKRLKWLENAIYQNTKLIQDLQKSRQQLMDMVLTAQQDRGEIHSRLLMLEAEPRRK